MSSLTPTQERALAKLDGQWRSSYALQEPRGVLDALVHRGLAQRRNLPGAMAFPRVGIEYRKA